MFSGQFIIRQFFFFQAEDGIRDGHVTGVQTCALPILIVVVAGGSGDDHDQTEREAGEAHALLLVLDRSEERRVGKEYRDRQERTRLMESGGRGYHWVKAFTTAIGRSGLLLDFGDRRMR